MKTTIKKTETTEIEVDIELPYYSKVSDYYYRINEAENITRVTVNYDNSAAWICKVDSSQHLKGEALSGEISDKAEFESIYNRAINIIMQDEVKQISESILHQSKEKANGL